MNHFQVQLKRKFLHQNQIGSDFVSPKYKWYHDSTPGEKTFSVEFHTSDSQSASHKWRKKDCRVIIFFCVKYEGKKYLIIEDIIFRHFK